MYRFKIVFLALALLLPFAATGASAKNFKLEEYFSGTTYAEGNFRAINGVSRAFKVKLTGSWNGKRLKLVEDFVYDDGERDRKTWLFTKTADWRYAHQVAFDSHAPGGMSSTMCFNRRFAQALLQDIEQDTAHQYTDNVVAHVTMPRFRCKVSDVRTCIYHAHEGSITSRDWLPNTFK